MRFNLVVLAILLALVAVKSRDLDQPVNPQWQLACADGVEFPLGPGGFYAEWLEIENGRYLSCDQCSTSSEVRERGRTELQGERLTLISDQGKRSEYRLNQSPGMRWYLTDAKGKTYGQERETQPRLHPSPDWLDKNLPLELDAPPAPPPKPTVLKPSLSDHQFFPLIELPMANSDLEGSRLIQGGRDLLNQRSTRRDVESLFGPLKWRIVEGPHNHGTGAEARRGNLLIRVYWILGKTPDEARVIGFSQRP